TTSERPERPSGWVVSSTTSGATPRQLHPFPTRRSSDLEHHVGRVQNSLAVRGIALAEWQVVCELFKADDPGGGSVPRAHGAGHEAGVVFQAGCGNGGEKAIQASGHG